MGDTPTANLGLVKMGVGTHRDSWGDVANSNLDKIDTGVKAAVDAAKNASDAAGKALSTNGGEVAGDLTLDGKLLHKGDGAFPHFADAAIVAPRIFFGPATGADPRGTSPAPGDVWLQY